MKGCLENSTIVGIDLGTTNSCISVMKDKFPKIIPSKLGKRTTPSTVTFGEKVVVGDNAKENGSGLTVFGSKRLIGKKFSDPEVQRYAKNLPFSIVPHANGDVWIKVREELFAPSQIAAFVLSKLKGDAERHLKKPVTKSVITVPAYFNEAQRQATKDAGKMAGLDVVRIINEPTAAALAYGLDRTKNGIVVIFDLGGGTFDISVLEIKDGVFEVKSTNGNTHLGGEDVDTELAEYILSRIEKQEGVRTQGTGLLKRIRKTAEEAKIQLSGSASTEVRVPKRLFEEEIGLNKDEDGVQSAELVRDGGYISIFLTREELERVSEKVLRKTVAPCKKAMRDANICPKDVRYVVLVGGMTKMPLVQKIVEEVFEKKPIFGVDPDEAVARGAAIQAGVLSGRVDNLLLLDVASLSLGIETVGGVFSPIIKRNTTLPTKETQVFTTSEDNQTEVDINIYQGERPLVRLNKHLGSIRLKDIPKAPRNVPKIEVTFELDANGICKVTARDTITSRDQSVEILPSGGLSREEVDRIVRESKESKRSDQDAVNAVECKRRVQDFIKKMRASGKGRERSRRIEKASREGGVQPGVL